MQWGQDSSKRVSEAGSWVITSDFLSKVNRWNALLSIVWHPLWLLVRAVNNMRSVSFLASVSCWLNWEVAGLKSLIFMHVEGRLTVGIYWKVLDSSIKVNRN